MRPLHLQAIIKLMVNTNHPLHPELNEHSEPVAAGNSRENALQAVLLHDVLCVRGFDKVEHERVVQQILSVGGRVTQTINGAAVVVYGQKLSRAEIHSLTDSGKLLINAQDMADWVNARVKPENALAGVDPERIAAAKASPMLDLSNGRVRLFGVDLGVGTGNLPDGFELICFDQDFAENLFAIACGAGHGMPVALEGATGAAKTTAVKWLGALLGRKVYRLNLSGQSDTGDLIGRFVPSSGLTVADLEALRPVLDARSLSLLDRAHAEGRALGESELAWVAGRERMSPPQWSFRDGVVIDAMRGGGWLLLDELNLADPRVIERLNSVLESPAALVVNECDNRRIGAGGDEEVHVDFRIFATMNPSGYSGRQPLSPALRDRFPIWHHTTGAGDMVALLRLLALGEQPVVTINGQAWRAAATTPQLPRLGRLPTARDLLSRVGRFHHDVASMAKSRNGSGVVFTRRSLLNAMVYLHRNLEGAPKSRQLQLVSDALDMFYVRRLADTDERRAVNSLLRAHGLQ